MCRALNYSEHFLIFISAVIVCVSISAFASLVVIPIGITSSAVALNICLITAEIKKYKSIINNRRMKHDKIVLLVKAKLDTIEVLISDALINSYISHDSFASVNNPSREYNTMKKETKNSETFM